MRVICNFILFLIWLEPKVIRHMRRWRWLNSVPAIYVCALYNVKLNTIPYSLKCFVTSISDFETTTLSCIHLNGWSHWGSDLYKTQNCPFAHGLVIATASVTNSITLIHTLWRTSYMDQHFVWFHNRSTEISNLSECVLQMKHCYNIQYSIYEIFC